MRQLFTCGTLLCAAQLALNAAAVPEGYYPFPLKWDDNQFGTATDVSFLNHKPAGAHGRVIVKDGRFRTSPRCRGRAMTISISTALTIR